MTLCDDGHDEICFEGKDCPMCRIMGEHEKAIEKANDKIAVAEQHIQKLKEEAQ